MNAPNGVEIVEEYRTPEGNVESYARRKHADVRLRLAHSGDVYEQWLRSQDRREYRDYDFCVNPAREDPKKYNTFFGKFPFEHVEPPFDLKEEELERIRPILEHYDTNFCGGSPELSAYLWNWFALPLQHRGLKTEVAVVIQVRCVIFL